MAASFSQILAGTSPMEAMLDEEEATTKRPCKTKQPRGERERERFNILKVNHGNHG